MGSYRSGCTHAGPDSSGAELSGTKTGLMPALSVPYIKNIGGTSRPIHIPYVGIVFGRLGPAQSKPAVSARLA